MNYGIRIVCRPEVAVGFALAGLSAVEAGGPADAAVRIALLARESEVGVILIEDRLHGHLPEETRRLLARRPLPMLVPFPGPSWAVVPPRGEEYIVELLRQAIGYRVRLV